MGALQSRPRVPGLLPPGWTLPSRGPADLFTTAPTRILIVGPERVVAEDIAEAFEAAGAWVIGIASSVRAALALIDRAGRVDGAVIDLDLGGGTAGPVADELARRGIPFVLLTSGDARTVPDRFAHVPRCEQPFTSDKVVDMLIGGAPTAFQSRPFPVSARGAEGEVPEVLGNINLR